MVIEALLSSDSKENGMKEIGEIFPECQKLVLETNVVWTSGP